MGIQINGNTNNINAGIGSLSIEDLNELDIVGVATASNFKTGSSNLHSTGLTVGNALVHSTGINVGTGATVHCPSTNTLTFGTNSAERVRIDSNGRVGLGINNPSSYFSSYNRVVMGRTNDTGGMTIVSSTTSGGYISFADGTSGNQAYRGMIAYQHSGDYMTFGTDGGIERVRIDSSGYLIAKGDIRLRRTASDNGALYFGDTNNNYIFGSDADDVITFATAGTERLRINSGGTIGINETSPSSVLHVKHHNNNTADITIEGGGSGNAGIQFIPGGQTNSYFAYVDTNRNFRIQDHTSEKLRLVSGGNFAIGNTHGAKKIHISTTGNQKILIDPNYNNNSGGSSNSEANANNVVDSILVRTSFGDNAASQTNAGHKWGIKFQGYNGNDFTQNTSKVAAVYAVSEDEAGGYNRNVGLTFHTSPYNTNHREAMRINTNGYVTKPYHPAFCVTRYGGSHIQLHQNSNIDVDFPTKDFDNSNSFNTSNSRFTAPIAGKYYFGVQFYCGFSVTSVRVMHAVWKKNGTNTHTADLFGGIGNFGDANMNHYHPTTNAHVMLSLNAGDYVTFNTGTNSFIGSGNTYLYATAGSRFFGHLVC